MKFRCVAFDLDDTLVDTRRLLIPAAARECAQAMIDRGLRAELSQALAERERLHREKPRESVYERLVESFGVREGATPQDVAEAGRLAFHRRDVASGLEPFPAALGLLEILRRKYKLYLVTSGDSGTQLRKIEAFGLSGRFDGVFAVDPSKGERKGDAFAAILRLSGARPDECLSVGNRVDTDIAEAKGLGWKTCWVMQGEYARMLPENELETPDFRVEGLDQLVAACGL